MVKRLAVRPFISDKKDAAHAVELGCAALVMAVPAALSVVVVLIVVVVATVVGAAAVAATGAVAAAVASAS